jgi:hypothetical protein
MDGCGKVGYPRTLWQYHLDVNGVELGKCDICLTKPVVASFLLTHVIRAGQLSDLPEFGCRLADKPLLLTGSYPAICVFTRFEGWAE